MEDLRKELFWHPQLGVLERVSEDGTCRLSNANTFVRMQSPMETVYERDRRAWVEEAMLKELVETDGLLNSSQVEKTTQYFCEAYDVIQKTISNFQTNK
jgi:hypothetical protein